MFKTMKLKNLRFFFVGIVVGLATQLVFAQQASLGSVPAVPYTQPYFANEPIPDARQLLQEVEAHRNAVKEALVRYTYKEQDAMRQFDKRGRLLKATSSTAEYFWVNGHEISSAIDLNGKPLTAKEQKKEQASLAKEISLAERTPSNKLLESHGAKLFTLLETMSLSQPKRVLVNGRPTLLIEFVGKQHAHLHGRVKRFFEKVSGAIWIDEQDRDVEHVELQYNERTDYSLKTWQSYAGEYDAKGSRQDFYFKRYAPGVWLSSKDTFNFVKQIPSTVPFVYIHKAHTVEITSTYSDFHLLSQQEKAAILSGNPPSFN